jgi:hypothetical protein
MTPEDLFKGAHGKRFLHFGASRTWGRLNEKYAGHGLSMQQVRNLVAECPYCQKARNTGSLPLKAVTLNLKPATYLKAIGIDILTVTPQDVHGHKAVILLVEHFAHFPQAYPLKDYSAETIAQVLFVHFCTFGVFDDICSDPGSSFMSEVVVALNGYLGMRHKVSLVGRHESNGTEGTNKQFVRHLQSIVHDERVLEKWSDPTVFPIINFSLCSHPTSETGGYTPFQLKYGTVDAPYFRLPSAMEQDVRDSAPGFLQRLDENIAIVRDASRKHQLDIVAERRKHDDVVQNTYQPGDFVLWNPREKPSDHLKYKLQTAMLGPYEVLSQDKNDVKCRHLVLRTESIFHVRRLLPFWGTLKDAWDMAKLDDNQFRILSINFWTGNPHKRRSMVFNITWDDGSSGIKHYSEDLASSEQYRDYVHACPELFPLRFPSTEYPKEIAKVQRTSITAVSPGQLAYVNLRFYDGQTSTWFDSLELPSRFTHAYVCAFLFTGWTNSKHTRINATCKVFSQTFSGRSALTPYDIDCYASVLVFDPSTMILVDQALVDLFPRIRP